MRSVFVTISDAALLGGDAIRKGRPWGGLFDVIPASASGAR